MIYEPVIEVICDACGASEEWMPEYRFTDWSGKSGYYDTSDGAVEEWMETVGWKKSGRKDLCQDCST